MGRLNTASHKRSETLSPVGAALRLSAVVTYTLSGFILPILERRDESDSLVREDETNAI